MDVLEIANKITSGFLIVFDLMEPVPFNIDKIDWDMIASNSPSSFSLYLHALSPFKFLLQAYNISPQGRYIDSAIKFIESWLDYNSNEQIKKNRFLWRDHPVSSRVMVLIDLIGLPYLYKSTFIDKIHGLILAHADWLNTNGNYTYKHNHGIMQDIALVKCSYYVGGGKGKAYLSNAKKRLINQMKFAFPNKHAQSENSTTYYFLVKRLLNEVNTIFQEKGDKFGSKTSSFLDSLGDFEVFLYMPNLTTPLIGETYGEPKQNPTKILKKEYADFITKKVKGYRSLSKRNGVFLNDGYIFLRNSKICETDSDTTWLSFKSGYITPTHKHCDDLSFVLFSKGYDIFIDPGFVRDEFSNEITAYFKRCFAHNLVVVDNNSYTLNTKSKSKTKLTNYSSNKDFDYSAGVNVEYPNVELKRELYFYPDSDQLIIVDTSKTNSAHKYSQLFHLGKNISVIKQDWRQTVLKIGESDYSLIIEQFNKSDSIENFCGDSNKPYSLYSIGMHKYIPTETLLYNWTCKNLLATTLISIVRNNEVINSKSYISSSQNKIISRYRKTI